MKYLSLIVKYIFSGTARTAVSFSGVLLNNRESNRMSGAVCLNCINLSANVSTFLIAASEGIIYSVTNTDKCL